MLCSFFMNYCNILLLKFVFNFLICYEDWEGVVPPMWEETLNSSFHGRTWYLKSLWACCEESQNSGLHYPIFVSICKANTKAPKNIYQMLKNKTIKPFGKKKFFIWNCFFSCEASLSSRNLTDLQADSQLAIFNLAATYRPLMKKLVLQNVSHFHQWVQNWFSKQEIELSKQEIKLSKQEMELFYLLPGLWLKNLFYKLFLIFKGAQNCFFE